jgi:hypothetical protein
MSSKTVERSGSPSPRPAKNLEGKAAKGIGTVNVEKANRVPGDLLARTIACQPPNEARIRGIVV